MGVLGLTYFIFDKFSRCAVKRFRKTTRVYFDGNDVIHGACGSIGSNDIHLATEEIIRFMKGVLSGITSQVTEIHFVIDGVCCVGKIQQQRNRRLTPSDEVRSYDTLMITSGTPFMKELSETLACKFQTAFTDAPSFVHYDLDAGEGEHVIFDLIAEKGDDGVTNLVVGRDGDISNIAMMRKAKNVLIRTSQNVEGVDIERFIDVDKYVECLREMEVDPQMWVVCMFLAGNDFLPHMFGIHGTFTPIGIKILNTIQGKTFSIEWTAEGVFKFIRMFCGLMAAFRKRDPHYYTEMHRYDDVYVAVHRNNASVIRATDEVRLQRSEVTGPVKYSQPQLRSAKIDALANYVDVFLWNIAYYLGSKRIRSSEVYYKYGIPPCMTVLNEGVYDLISSRVKNLRVFKVDNHKMSVEEQHSIVMPQKIIRDTHRPIETFTNDKPDYRWTRIFLPIPCEPFSSLRYVNAK